MTFSSLAFLFVFFPIVFLLYWICNNRHIRNALLIIASLIFYAYGEPVAVFIMLISVCLNYVFGLMCSQKHKSEITNDEQEIAEQEIAEQEIEKPNHTILNKLGLVAAILMNIGLLVAFKYSGFIFDSMGIKHSVTLKLPIGISFFTFQGLSYVVDVYRDKKSLQKNFFSVMLYISFFPQLIAGPIVKFHDIKEQLTNREFNIDRVSNGLQRFIFGLGKKVLIAGPMGLMVDSIFELDVTTVGMWTAWIVAVSYMLQIYFDFSGYSDMAIGLGCIFGFDFKENFDKPYSAGSIKLFWRKWHISLSTWFKEYVYIPLGGNRKGTVRTYINKFTVFILTGIWHGANWTFLCWGVLHGIGLIIEDFIKKIWNSRHEKVAKPIAFIFKVFGHIYTLLFVMVAFVIFRADNLHIAWVVIGKLISGVGSDLVAFSLLTPVYLIALVLAVIFSSTILDRLVSKINKGVLQAFSIVVYVLCIAMLISGGYNPFIYFRF